MHLQICDCGMSPRICGFAMCGVGLTTKIYLCKYPRWRKNLHVVFKYLFRSLYAGILEQYMGTRKRVGIGFSYRPVRLHRLVELIPWNRFLDSFKVKKSQALVYEGGGGDGKRGPPANHPPPISPVGQGAFS